MTHWRKFDDPNYMGAYYLEHDKDLIVEIARFEQGVAKSKDGEKKKGLIYFKGHSKPLLMNATNGKMISRILKSEQVEDWIGKRISLYVTREKAFGETIDVVRVRATLPPQTAPNSEPTQNKPVLDVGHEKWGAAVASVKEGKTTIEAILKVWDIKPTDLDAFKQAVGINEGE